MAVIEELERQLGEWRTNLPQSLQWSDSDRTSYAHYDMRGQHLCNTTFTEHSHGINNEQPRHAYNEDVVTAQLRCRFYYCQLMLFRPFLYKALHVPDQATKQDLEYATRCLQSCILWPMCMNPLRNKKRLLPNTYVWTQSFVMILLILKLAEKCPFFTRFWEENKTKVDETVRSMLAWLEDMRQVDAMSAWGSEILEPLYGSGAI
jgi:hypothetical protein